MSTPVNTGNDTGLPDGTQIADTANDAGAKVQLVQLDLLASVGAASSPVTAANPLPVTGTLAITSSTLATTAKQDTLLTELQLKADLSETQPVSLAALPALVAGSAVIGHVIADSGSTTAVTGNVTVVQGTGTNLHVVVDSAPATAVTGTFWQATQPVSGTFWQATQPVSAATLPLPSGAATEATLALLLSLANTFKTRSDTYTTTANGVTVNASAAPLQTFSVAVKGTGAAATTWDVRVEGSLDNVNFTTILTHTNTTGDGIVLFSGAVLSPSLYFRTRCAGLVLGGASNIVVTLLGQV